MATEVEMLGFLIVFAVALIFGILGVERKSQVFCLISSITWFILAPLHMQVTFDTNMYTVMWLWFGFGWIWLVLTVAYTIDSMLDLREQKKWTV